jgi:hypothetical protein
MPVFSKLFVSFFLVFFFFFFCVLGILWLCWLPLFVILTFLCRGDDCSILTTPITLGVPVRAQSLMSRQWHYYTLSVSGGSGLRVTVNQTSASGDVDLYIQKNALPTRSSYLAREVSGSRQFTVHVNSSVFGPGTWYLGCYAFQRVTYDIVAMGETGRKEKEAKKGRKFNLFCFAQCVRTTARAMVSASPTEDATATMNTAV